MGHELPTSIEILLFYTNFLVNKTGVVILHALTIFHASESGYPMPWIPAIVGMTIPHKILVNSVILLAKAGAVVRRESPVFPVFLVFLVVPG